MNRIWAVLLLASLGVAYGTGRMPHTASALLESGDDAVHLLLTMLASMTLWSGLMEILVASGDVKRLGRLFRRLGRPLLPTVQDEGCWDAISLNLSANLLGLGNAATPAGIEATRRLAALGEGGLEALAMLLAIDNAGLQLLPTTVLSLRQAAGARDPADVWGMTILVSVISTIVAILLMKACFRVRRRRR